MAKELACPDLSASEKGRNMQLLLRDFHALERLLEENRFERDQRRIGSELELNFVDQDGAPSPIGAAVRDALRGEQLTTEFSRFNLELNSEPLALSGRCFTKLKESLGATLAKVKAEANRRDSRVLLTGIIPALNKHHIPPEALSPEPHYENLYKIRRALKGEQYEYHIRGVDELRTRDNIALFAGCVTSFQAHLQVDAYDLVDSYNWSQLLAGPVLACSAYSPLFLGKRLWHETRVALFEQGADTQNPDTDLSRHRPRVFFGDYWLKDSVLELLQEDIAGFEPLFALDEVEDPWEAMEQGATPSLESWRAFNGSIYRWNRVCYGCQGDNPSLRIENRILPSGPTLEDMVANTAFWTGAMVGLTEDYRDLADKLAFADAKENFFKAARLGLDVSFHWIDGRSVPARELIIEELLPVARSGLQNAGVAARDIDHYLGIIADRVKTGKTGSRWMIDSYNRLTETAKRDEALVALTAGMIARQDSGSPVHTWETVEADEAGSWRSRFNPVRKVMTTTLYKVGIDDVVDLAAHIMEWKSVGHIPVEDSSGRLVGIINKNAIINYMIKTRDQSEPTRVGDLMVKNPLTVDPETSLNEAIRLILKNEVSCLPVVTDGRIVGIVTERDFVEVAQGLVAELEREKA